MADWQEVMNEQRAARLAQESLQEYGGRIEDSESGGDVALAVVLAADAICSRLRALETMHSYLAAQHGR